MPEARDVASFLSHRSALSPDSSPLQAARKKDKQAFAFPAFLYPRHGPPRGQLVARSSPPAAAERRTKSQPGLLIILIIIILLVDWGRPQDIRRGVSHRRPLPRATPHEEPARPTNNIIFMIIIILLVDWGRARSASGVEVHVGRSARALHERFQTGEKARASPEALPDRRARQRGWGTTGNASGSSAKCGQGRWGGAFRRRRAPLRAPLAELGCPRFFLGPRVRTGLRRASRL